MKILLSIKPEYAEKILSGEKGYEYRKALPVNRQVKTVVIYATMPVGKVIGEFDVGGFLSEIPEVLWEQTSKRSGISKDFYDTYFYKREKANAIKVSKKRRYATPKNLQEVLGRPHPPQSFCYI